MESTKLIRHARPSVGSHGGRSSSVRISRYSCKLAERVLIYTRTDDPCDDGTVQRHGRYVSRLMSARRHFPNAPNDSFASVSRVPRSSGAYEIPSGGRAEFYSFPRVEQLRRSVLVESSNHTEIKDERRRNRKNVTAR